MSKANQGRSRKKVILIVDDELDMRTFLSTLVKIGGYEAVSAKNAEEGILKAEEIRPDLLILDVMMPGEGGVLMYNHLKADASLKQTPVIMLSAVAKNAFYHYLGTLNIRLDGSILSPDAYIEKPPEAEKLMKTIKSILGGKQDSKFSEQKVRTG
ncbi:MAG: response regulator [Syntrophobacteraceae bacterium]